MLQPKYKMQRNEEEIRSLDLSTAVSNGIFEALSLIQKTLRTGWLTFELSRAAKRHRLE
ncbi:MAG: hypothetical protein ACK5JB_07845 [Pseudanabaena sp.]|jgi:hypothetical protein